MRSCREVVAVIWALMLFDHTVQATDLSDKYFLFLIVPLTYIEDLTAHMYRSSVLIPRV